MKADFKLPPPYAVYVTVAPTKTNGLKEPLVARVGPADSINGAIQRIADDRKAMGETCGGLIEPVTTANRTYRIFKAEWKEIKP